MQEYNEILHSRQLFLMKLFPFSSTVSQKLQGFEKLAVEISKPSKSLHRMLSAKGNPTMDNLTTILGVLRKTLHVNITVQTVSCT
jgi:DNA-binding phage protein